MKRNALRIIAVLFVAMPAMAAQFDWVNSVQNAWWTNANSWAGAVVPDNDGTADIVLANTAGAYYYSWINESWNVNSLRYTGGANGFDISANTPATQVLHIGAGGITGTNRWLHIRPKVTFTASDVSLNYGNIYFYSTLDSSAPGGTLLRVKGENWQYVQTYSSKSTANITWSIEGGQIANYGANPNDFFGPNTVKVAGVADSGQRYIGYYGNTPSNDLYINNEFEIDTAVMDNTPVLNFVIDRGHSTAGQTQITHFQSKLTTKGGVAFTNTSGAGVFTFYGGNNDMKKRIYHEADNSGLQSAAITSKNAWSGDFAINSGWHVVNAAHAFKSNNTARVNLTDQSGGTTIISNRQFLLNNGITYNGDVAIWGGSSMTNSAGVGPEFRLQASAWVGIEGTGSAEYNGRILISRADDLTEYGNRGFNAVFYATNGGTAHFYGNIEESDGALGQKAFITGGGNIVFGGTCTYTNRTTVMSNTTFQLDGSMTSEIEVLAGSTLKGAGSTGSNVSLGGDFAPGASLGTFTAYADVDFGSGSTLTIELGPGNTSDLLDVYGDLDIGSAILRLVGSDIGTFTIANYGSLTGEFLNIDTMGLASGLSLDTSVYATGINYGGKDGNFISLTVIPEPASFLLLASGLVAAWKLRRRA